MHENDSTISWSLEASDAKETLASNDSEVNTTASSHKDHGFESSQEEQQKYILASQSTSLNILETSKFGKKRL